MDPSLDPPWDQEPSSGPRASLYYNQSSSTIGTLISVNDRLPPLFPGIRYVLIKIIGNADGRISVATMSFAVSAVKLSILSWTSEISLRSEWALFLEHLRNCHEAFLFDPCNLNLGPAHSRVQRYILEAGLHESNQWRVCGGHGFGGRASP